MSLSADAMRLLAERGLTLDEIIAVAEANAPGQAAETSADRRRRLDRERKRAARLSAENAENSADKADKKAVSVSALSADNSAKSAEICGQPRARVEDNLLTTQEPCLSLSLDFARDCAGDALANPARAHGVMILRDLMRCQAEGCTIDEIGDGIREAAAWYLNRDGPGSMTTWTLAAKIARQYRDKRLNPPPVVVPMERPNERSNPAAKRVERHGNYARSFAGLEAVALARAGDG